ncbi:beta strand repeat-containing protein [Granulicella aggregans]|uniref:beta strand repeat-containing protein n=1 Tax=Granulicella aggregans TaxID=474949 RepID=UPI0021E05981|nr:FG-GAP-like repeat-containing protein [Granulicella aggregans]
MMSFTRRKLLVAALVLAVGGDAASLWATSPLTTSTTLTISSNSVTTGTAVVLTATVTASGAPVAAGLVTFCDATAIYCEGPAVLGSAQISTGGAAVLKHIFGPGDHSVNAIFAGTHAAFASASSTASISVSGTAASNTVAASSGSAANYSLTATVGYHGLATPAGSEMVSFIDTSNKNLLLGSADISIAAAPLYDFITIPTSPVTVGAIPAAVISGDFNNDGIPDFATANLQDNTISVFFGDGTGAFTQAAGSPFAVGAGPTALAVADLNADGHLDILSANAVAGSISILFGNASGGFSAGPNVTVGSGPQSIVAGDFNGDGLPDIAVANVYDSTITVLINDGSGGFASNPSTTYAVGQNPSWIGAADFNSDGFLDLAVVNTTSNNVTILKGDGVGGFTPLPGSPFATLSYPVSATVGDFNADGKADLAVVSATGNTLSILLNTGTRLAASGSPYSTGDSPSAIAVSDFNGDGKQDLIVTNGNANTATVLFGDGTGAFSNGTNSVVANLDSPASVTTADFDGDGTQDLAITNVGGGSTSIRPLQITRSATATLASVVVPGAAIAHAISATYAGDTLYAASTSSPISLTGTPIATTDTLTISPTSSVEYGQVVQLTTAIAPPSASNYTATGTVKFFDGSTVLGQSNLSNGQALLSVNSFSVAQHSLSAAYAGDANFVASNSSSSVLTVNKAIIKITLTGTPGSGAAFTFTANVTSFTSGVPTGTVGFYDGNTLIGSSPLVAGVATYTVTSLAAGVHSVTATYSGDSDYVGGTSAALAASTGDFTFAAVQPAMTVLPGKSVAYQLTATPNTSFPNPITFSVTGLPAGATATFSPATLTPGDAATSTTMTVTVAKEVAGLHRLPSTLAMALTLFLLPFATLRRFRRAASSLSRALYMTVIVLAGTGALIVLTGCGSTGYLGQASRNYTLTVTAASGTLTHTTSLQLNVQ